MVTRLERAELKRRKSKAEKEPKMWTGACWCLGSRVGSVGHLTEELSYYNTEVSQSVSSAGGVSIVAAVLLLFVVLLYCCS